MDLSMGYETPMSYEDRARRRIALWLDTHPKITQRMVAEAASHLQPWVSSYRKGIVSATLDELDAMALGRERREAVVQEGVPDRQGAARAAPRRDVPRAPAHGSHPLHAGARGDADRPDGAGRVA